MSAPDWLPVAGRVLQAVLLAGSALVALACALGFVRLRDPFMRMHALALLTGGGVILAGAAAALGLLRAGAGGGSQMGWVVLALMGLGSPITSVILARAILHRARSAERRR